MTDRLQDEKDPKITKDQDDVFAVEDEGSSESWQDDLPPEDDFHDGDVAEDDGLDEPQAEDLDYEPEDAYAEEAEGIDEGAAKKRGKGVLIGVLAVGALLVGGMAYLQFSGSDLPVPMNNAAPAAGQVALAPVDAKVASAVSGLEPTSTSSTGGADISALYSEAQSQTASAEKTLPSDLGGVDAISTQVGVSTEVMTLDEEKSAAPNALPTVSLEKTAQAPVIAKVEEIPMPELQPQPEMQKQDAPKVVDAVVAPIPAAPVAAPAPVVAPVVDTNKGGAQTAALAAQIDELTTALSDERAKNEDLVSELKTLREAEAKLADYEKVQEKVKTLEQTIASMKKAEKSKPVVAKSSKPAKKEVKTAKKAAKPVVAKAKPAKVEWVLRAATPEAAWVSKSDYAAELRRVAVGESLPGLGRIKAIRQSGEVWELVGSQGTLR